MLNSLDSSFLILDTFLLKLFQVCFGQILLNEKYPLLRLTHNFSTLISVCYVDHDNYLEFFLFHEMNIFLVTNVFSVRKNPLSKGLD